MKKAYLVNKNADGSIYYLEPRLIPLANLCTTDVSSMVHLEDDEIRYILCFNFAQDIGIYVPTKKDLNIILDGDNHHRCNGYRYGIPIGIYRFPTDTKCIRALGYTICSKEEVLAPRPIVEYNLYDEVLL